MVEGERNTSRRSIFHQDQVVGGWCKHVVLSMLWMWVRTEFLKSAQHYPEFLRAVKGSLAGLGECCTLQNVCLKIWLKKKTQICTHTQGLQRRKQWDKAGPRFFTDQWHINVSSRAVYPTILGECSLLSVQTGGTMNTTLLLLHWKPMMLTVL